MVFVFERHVRVLNTIFYCTDSRRKKTFHGLCDVLSNLMILCNSFLGPPAVFLAGFSIELGVTALLVATAANDALHRRPPDRQLPALR